MYKWLTGLLGLYALFTSGIVYAVTGESNTLTLDIPFSLAISGEQSGLSGVFYKDDIECAKWIADNKQDKIVVADYNGILLLRSYIPLNTQIENMNTYMRLEKDKDVPSNVYVFCTSWNTKHGEYVTAAAVALRSVVKIDYTGMTEVHRIGDAIVYER